MVYYQLGEVLGELRRRAKLTQEELAEGICSISSISRIERGDQMPSIQIMDELFARLGHSTDFFVGLGSSFELESMQNWESLVYWAHNQSGTEKISEKQLLEYVLAVELQEKKEDVNVMGRLLGALSLSLSLEEIYRESPRQLYTYQELHIFNSLAVEYYRRDNLEIATRMLEKLYRYMKNQYIDEKVMQHLYPVLLNNLSIMKLTKQRYPEALGYCKEGIAVSLQRGYLKPLPYLYGTMCNICDRVGRRNAADEAYCRMQQMIDIMDDNLSRPLLIDRLSEPFILVNPW